MKKYMNLIGKNAQKAILNKIDSKVKNRVLEKVIQDLDDEYQIE